MANIIDTAIPTVNIVSPVENCNVSGIVPVTAVVGDDTGLTGIFFFVDGVPLSYQPLPTYPKSATTYINFDTQGKWRDTAELCVGYVLSSKSFASHLI